VQVGELNWKKKGVRDHGPLWFVRFVGFGNIVAQGKGGAMATEDRFKKSVVATLAMRAANQCSNPDCGAITSGPSVNPSDSVNVGEAAHIYGANPGSARFDPSMLSSDRGAISNAIWLCATCHKIIDDDPLRFPSGLLFEWQRNHEQKIASTVGKAGAAIRKRYEERHLEEFGRLSYLAERLILEKDDFWEYRLTSEVLRFEMTPILRRWNSLKRGLYFKQNVRIEKMDFIPWVQSRIAEVKSISSAFSELINAEFSRAWGESGVAGNDVDIVETCRLFCEMCQSALLWEETVRFATVDEIFSEVQTLFIGAAGRIIEEAAKLPAFLSETLAGSPSGKYHLNLTLDLPEGWSEAVEAALERCTNAILSSI
jgi:hypothetical protein